MVFLFLYTYLYAIPRSNTRQKKVWTSPLPKGEQIPVYQCRHRNCACPQRHLDPWLASASWIMHTLYLSWFSSRPFREAAWLRNMNWPLYLGRRLCPSFWRVSKSRCDGFLHEKYIKGEAFCGRQKVGTNMLKYKKYYFLLLQYRTDKIFLSCKIWYRIHFV